MLVLAALRAFQLPRLRRGGEGRFGFVRARGWEEALDLIRTRPAELAVVDPLLSGEARRQEIERLRVLFPSLPIFVYTTLMPQTAGVLLALGRHGIQHVVFAHHDDHPALLRRVLADEAARTTSQRLVAEIAAGLTPLPANLRAVIEEALRSPTEVQRVRQVAERARVDRRTFYRWITRAGLPSPRHFLAAARALYSHRLLQDPGFTIKDVVPRLRYSHANVLQQHARAYLGLTAGEMRVSLTPEEALQQVSQRFRHPAAGVHRAAS